MYYCIACNSTRSAQEWIAVAAVKIDGHPELRPRTPQTLSDMNVYNYINYITCCSFYYIVLLLCCVMLCEIIL